MDNVGSLQQRLADAERAYDRLMLGEAFVRVRLSDGSETEFKPTSREQLLSYIDDLRRRIAGDRAPRNGAMNVIF